MVRNPQYLITIIRDWFEMAKPFKTRNGLDVQVQTGVHFEEVHEMLQEMTAIDSETEVLIAKAKLAIHDLADHLKKSPNQVFMIQRGDDVNYLDAICDQIVTAIGTAHFMGYDIVGAIREVNHSNWSKFKTSEDGIMECIKDPNGKIAKGPYYQKAQLKPFTNSPCL